MKYDYRPSRLEGGKVLKNKRKVLGPWWCWTRSAASSAPAACAS